MYSRSRKIASFLFATLLILLTGCSPFTSGSNAAAPAAAIITDGTLPYPGNIILFSGL